MIIVCITAAVVISSPFQHVESWQMPNGESKEVLVWEKREEQWKPNQPCSFSSPWQRQEAEEVQGCPSPSPRPPPGWAAGSPGSSASSPSSGEGESSMYSRVVRVVGVLTSMMILGRCGLCGRSTSPWHWLHRMGAWPWWTCQNSHDKRGSCDIAEVCIWQVTVTI